MFLDVSRSLVVAWPACGYDILRASVMERVSSITMAIGLAIVP